MAATFNVDLINEVGRCIGEERELEHFCRSGKFTEQRGIQ